MSGIARPPFRADHVGSLLRPPELRDARARMARGEMERAALRPVEDAAIRGAVALQESVGLSSITDGEFRRDWWHIDFLRGFDGVETSTQSFGVKFEGADEQPPLMKVTSKIRRTKPSMLDHFTFLKAATSRTPKFCLPSPVMLHARGDRPTLRATYPNLDEFWSDLTAAYRDEIRALCTACTVLRAGRDLSAFPRYEIEIRGKRDMLAVRTVRRAAELPSSEGAVTGPTEPVAA